MTKDDCPAARVLPGGVLDSCVQPYGHPVPHRTAAGTVFPVRKVFVCPRCGVEMDEPESVETTALGSVFSTTVYGRPKPCPTPKCGEVCKLCRREVGDVHGPDCGPLMVTKLERPHIVDRSDCT